MVGNVRSRWVVAGIFAAMVGNSGALAAEAVAAPTRTGKGEQAFRVVSAAIHAEASRAEICLSLSAPADVTDRSDLAASIRLKKNGKIQTVDARDLSLTPSDICVQQLEHGANYDLRLSRLQSQEGKKLSTSYHESFAVPNRKTALWFLGGAPSSTFPRLGREDSADGAVKAPQLRSVNVSATRLTLYRLNDPQTYAGAWQPFVQGGLTPSEGLYYARTRGQSVFETELVFGDKPNEEQTLAAPLPADATLTPGLYFLAAAPRGKGEEDPGLFAGQWFRVSNLDVDFVQTPDGYQVFVSDVKTHTPVRAATVELVGSGGNILATGKTAQDGALLLKPEDKGASPAFVLARTDAGDMDLVDVAHTKNISITVPSLLATLVADRDVYAPGFTATVMLRAEDIRGYSQKLDNTLVRLVRPDGRVYSEHPVGSVDGLAALNIPLPVTESAKAWSFVWVRADGSFLAQSSLRLTDDPRAARMEPPTQNDEMKQEETIVAVTQDGLSIRVTPLPSLMNGPGVTQRRFAVASFDEFGAQRSATNLYYVVVEEGRSFEWYPADGRWAYQPLPQRRRVAGGRVIFTQNGESSISFSATPGQYTLQIMKGDGTVLARNDFLVGILGTVADDPQNVSRLKTTTIPETLQAGKAASLGFRWDADGFVTLTAIDDRVRQTVHRYVRAGEGVLKLEPTETWGRKVAVRVNWRGINGKKASWQSFLPVVNPAQELKIETTLSSTKPLKAASGLALPLRVGPLAKGQLSHVSVVATSVPEHVDQELAVARVDHQPLDAEGKAVVHLNLPSFDGVAKIRIMAWNAKQFGVRTLTVPVRRTFVIDGIIPERITQGDRADARVSLTNRGGEGLYTYAIHAPEGVTVRPSRGKLRLPRGEASVLSFTMTAQTPVDGDVILDVMGPNGFKQSQSWPVVIRSVAKRDWHESVSTFENGQSVRWPEKEANAAGSRWALVSPAALVAPGSALQALADGGAKTTSEMSRWLEALRLWEGVLDESGLMSRSRQERERQKTLRQLLLRQNEDGGFPVSQKGGASDLQSTADALSALQGEAEHPASMAATWLVQKLQNTWFDETERDARAKAFAALVKIGKADLASLRYFAETSRDKHLGAEACAALAAAFAPKAEDDAQARYWLDRVGAVDTPLSWRALYYLARNDKLPLDQWSQRAALNEKELRQPDIQKASLSLAAMGQAIVRSGSWRIQLNGKEEKSFTAMALTHKAKQAAINIKNVSGRRLWLLDMKEGAAIKSGKKTAP